jgi:hypothetical protein
MKYLFMSQNHENTIERNWGKNNLGEETIAEFFNHIEVSETNAT